MSTKAQRERFAAFLAEAPKAALDVLAKAFASQGMPNLVAWRPGGDGTAAANWLVGMLLASRRYLVRQHSLAIRQEALARECRHCGNGYIPRRSDSRYCSTRCRVAAHRAKVTPT